MFKQDQTLAEHLHQQLEHKPWIYTQGRFESDRGVFRVRIEPLSCRNLQPLFVNQCTVGSNSEILYELSDDFSIIEKPVFAMHRYASGNVGHVFLENLNMVVTLMMQYNLVGFGKTEKDALNNHILFLDDVFSLEGEDWMASYKYPPQHALKYSTQVAGLFSSNPILQLCRRRHVFSIEKSPCRNDLSRSWTRPRKVLQTCFSQFYAGLTVDLFFFPYGREMIMTQMRNLAYTNLNIVPHPTAGEEDVKKYLQHKDLVVSIHKKPLSGKHGAAIANADELLDFLSLRLPKIPFVKDLKKKVRVELVNLGNMTIPEQVQYFSEVDVYITDQGSAVYYSMFMRDDTSVLMAPACVEGQRCTHGVGNRMQSCANVNFFNLLELNGEILPKCVERPVPEKSNNCDPILPFDVVFDGVKSMLKARFRKLERFW